MRVKNFENVPILIYWEATCSLKLVPKENAEMKFVVKCNFQHDRVKHKMHAMNRYCIRLFSLKEREIINRTTELKILLSLLHKVAKGQWSNIYFACLSKTPFSDKSLNICCQGLPLTKSFLWHRLSQICKTYTFRLYMNWSNQFYGSLGRCTYRTF